MEPINRRTFLRTSARWGVGAAAAGALAPVLAACGSSSKKTSTAPSSGSLTPVPYQLGWIPNAEFAGTYIALQKGYFKAAGVDVTIIPGGPTANLIGTLESGKALVTIADPILAATAVKQGADLRIIGAQYERSPYAITSLAKNPINNPKDMIGRKIGLAASDTSNWQAFLKLNGIAASQVPTVPIQFDPTVLVEGVCEGIVAFSYEQSSELEQKGVATTSFLWDDYGFKSMWNTYIVTGASLQDTTKRGALVGFLTGEARGWTEQVANPGTGAQLAVSDYGSHLGLDAAEQTREAQGAKELIVTPASQANGLFAMEPALISSTRSLLNLLGLTLPATTFDTSVLAAVHKAQPSLSTLAA